MTQTIAPPAEPAAPAVPSAPSAPAPAAPAPPVPSALSEPPTAGAAVTGSAIDELVARADRARRAYDAFGQEQVDAIVRDIGKYVYDNASMLARLAVDETGIGVFEDKIAKNQGKARLIWNSLKDKKSRGVIGEEPVGNLVLVAKPVGIVGAVAPVTNPIVTPMCNAMFALKTGNAIIFAPHPKAQACTIHLTQVFRAILREHGAPEDLVQVLPKVSIGATQDLMRAVDVVVATGGEAMVKAAYSSGKPSFGVGAGNVPVILDEGIDVRAATEMIVAGASFDNGIICSHEQFVIVPAAMYDQTVAGFLATDRVWYCDDPQVIDRFRTALFPDGAFNRTLVGKSPSFIGVIAGVSIPPSVRVIVLKVAASGRDDILAREKLCPVVALMPCDSFEDALAAAEANLFVEGAGHSAAIHSVDDEHVQEAALRLPVSRLVVNQPCALTAGGSLTNGLAPTTTLGCGSWGGNSISENLDYKHLMNVSRIGRAFTDRVPPTDAQIWA